jgi:hypothetical protein
MKQIFKVQFLSAFAKLRKWTISFVICVCPSVLPHGTTRFSLDGFSWNLLLDCFSKNTSRKLKFHYNLTTVAGTLNEDQYTFVMISRSVLLRMVNVSDKYCRENQNTHFPVIFGGMGGSCPLWNKVEKYCRAGQATNDNMALAHCVLGT